LVSQKGSETSTSGINVIEIKIHTCKSLQGLSLPRRFAKGELDVHVDNGAKVAAIAVDTYYLVLPSQLVLKLNNYYCISALCKNIISSSCLEEVDGYEIIIKNMCCTFYYKGMFYAHCPLVNGVYILDLEDKSVCSINTKRASLNDFNPTFICHYRLGQIMKSALRDSVGMVCSAHLILNHLARVSLV
jgi:hypothetical protein